MKKPSPYVIAISALLIIIVLCLANRRSYSKTYEAYISAYTAGDAKKVVSLMPKEYISHLKKTGEIQDESDLINRVQNMLNWYLQAFENRCGENYTYENEITSTCKYSEGNADVLMQNLKVLYGDASKKIKNASEISFFHNIYANDLPEDSLACEEYQIYDSVVLVQIGQKWYVGTMGDAKNF